MTEIAALLALLYAILCGAIAGAHGRKVGRLTLLDWALLAMGGMYGMGWIVVLLVTRAGGNPEWERWIEPFSALYVVHTSAACLLVSGVLGGWYLFSRRLPIRQSEVSGRNGADARSWSLAFWWLLLLAVLLQGAYAKAYGGYFGVIEYSALIRSALFAAVPDNPWSFLQPFGGLAMVAAYGFFGLCISGKCRAGTWLGLALSIGFSLYILYSWLGRMSFLVFLTTFALGWSLMRRPNPLSLIAWGFGFFAVLLGGAYGISVWLNLKAADSFSAFLARELAFPFGSFFAQLSQGENLFRGFLDFFVLPIYFLPSSWWSNWFEPVSQVNTAVIMGAPKGYAGMTSEVPVDLLTLGLMQFHLVGVLVVGGMFGALLRVLQSWLDCIPLPGVRATFEAHLALSVAVMGVFYSQPDLVISGNFPLIAGAVITAAIVALRQFRVSSSRSVSRFSNDGA